MSRNVIARWPEAAHVRLVKLLDGRMLPARWLGLVIRERLEDRSPVKPRPIPGDLVRIVASGAGGVLERVNERATRTRPRSASRWCAWVALEALERLEKTGRLPEDVMGASGPGPLSRSRRTASAREREIERLGRRILKKITAKIAEHRAAIAAELDTQKQLAHPLSTPALEPASAVGEA